MLPPACPKYAINILFAGLALIIYSFRCVTVTSLHVPFWRMLLSWKQHYTIPLFRSAPICFPDRICLTPSEQSCGRWSTSSLQMEWWGCSRRPCEMTHLCEYTPLAPPHPVESPAANLIFTILSEMLQLWITVSVLLLLAIALPSSFQK